MSEVSDEFLHIKGDSNFQQRSSAVFSCLDILEPDHDIKNESEMTKQSEHESEGESYRPRRCRIPDHVVHPERWEKYSLEDVNEEVGGLSRDALNRHVALSFLDDLKNRKAENEEDTTSTETAQDEVLDTEMKEKIVFSKDIIKHKMEVVELTSPTAHCGVHVMPECVVGKTPSNKSKRTVTVAAPSSAQHAAGGVVGLSHLKEAEKESDADNSKSGSVETVEGERQFEVPLFPKRKSRGPHNFRKREKKETNDMN